MSKYYKQIKGKKYDRQLLEDAESFANKSKNGTIGLKGVKALYESAKDGGKVTKVEERTLVYIYKNFSFTRDASEWFGVLVGEKKAPPTSPYHALLEAFNVSNLQLNIAEKEVEQQGKLDNQQSFEDALKAGLNALIHEEDSSSSLRAIAIAEEGIHYTEQRAIDKAIIDYLNQGQLYLVPLNFPAKKCQGIFKFDLPEEVRSIEDFWLFGLEIPSKTDFHFLSHVRRRDFKQSYSFAYLPKPYDIAASILTIINQEFQLSGLDWKIDTQDAQTQELYPGVFFFSNALKKVIRSYLRDDTTPGSLLRSVQNAYPELKRENFGWVGEYWNALDKKLKPLLRTGTLSLITTHEQLEKEWLFDLQIPAFSNSRFIAKLPRDGSREASNMVQKK